MMISTSKRKYEGEEEEKGSAKQARISQIPLAIHKETSFLDGIQLVEYLPAERVRALLKSGHLKDKWSNSSAKQKCAKQNYANEVEQLNAYLKNYDRRLGGVVCKYKKPKHGWGRVFPWKSLGLTGFGKATRNTLIDGLYEDFDLENCQPNVIQNICKKEGIRCIYVDVENNSKSGS